MVRVDGIDGVDGADKVKCTGCGVCVKVEQMMYCSNTIMFNILHANSYCIFKPVYIHYHHSHFFQIGSLFSISEKTIIFPSSTNVRTRS